MVRAFSPRLGGHPIPRNSSPFRVRRVRFELMLFPFASPSQSPSVSFLGYTNQNGSTVASFRIQNGNRGTVTLCADAILWSRAQGQPPRKGAPPKHGPSVISVQTLKSGE